MAFPLVRRPHCGDGKDATRCVREMVLNEASWDGSFTLAAVGRSLFSTCGPISAHCWSHSYITHGVSFPAGASL